MIAPPRPLRRWWVVAVALAAASWSGSAGAQQPDRRPSEDELFGAPAGPTPPPPEGEPPAAAAPQQVPAPPPSEPEPTPPPSTPESVRDADILGDPGEAVRLSEEVAPDDPLKIGGLFYIRSLSSAVEDQPPDEWSFSTPFLLDAYLDARPNDRVRGLVLGRMVFDPTLPPNGADVAGPMIGQPEASGATMGSAPLSSLFVPRTRGPRVVLDQMWLRFDIKSTVFVTAGRQHVRWGTARFWTPTDYLHILRRNPLDVFDARVGTTMLKLHLPWESRGWNFYAYAVTEDVVSTPTVGRVAGAGRAEIVLGTSELGLGALVQQGRKPRYAIDLSTGLWDFDLYGEVALRYGSEVERVRFDDQATAPTMGGADQLARIVETLWPRFRDRGLKVQAVGGLSYSRQYADRDVWTLGVEYFYNQLGYDTPRAYPGLVLPRTRPLEDPATFFYLGRHYGALFLNLPAPYSWDLTTFTFSTLGNLSDQSFISRVDYSLLLLTHLRFEAFAAVRYGRTEGEFRFGVDNLQLGGITFSRKPAILDLGVALRLSI